MVVAYLKTTNWQKIHIM